MSAHTCAYGGMTPSHWRQWGVFSRTMATQIDKLQEMIDAIDAELRDLGRREMTLSDRKRVLTQWQAEERKNLPGQQLALTEAGDEVTPLSAFIRSSLTAGAHTTEELAEKAVKGGLVQVGKSPFRTLNFALLALQNAGVVRKTDEKWSLKPSR